MEFKVKRIHPDAKLPVYGHPGDAGLDLFSVADRDLAPGDVFAVPTGIQVAVPPGHVGLVWDKSGISLARRPPAGGRHRRRLPGRGPGRHDQPGRDALSRSGRA